MGRWIMLLVAAIGVGHISLAQMPSSSTRPASPDAGDRLNAQDLEHWTRRYLGPRMKEKEVAGATLSIVKDGETLFKAGFGYADAARHILMDAQQTVVGVASVSKLFAWTAVMQQVERGGIDLDADINQYLDFKIPEAFGQPVTMRHLMTHSAGFEDMWPRVLKAGEQSRPLDEFMRETTPPTRIRAPGEMVAYSNYGTALAGYIVERITGQPFATYVERHIFQPMQMRSSTFRDPPPPAIAARISKSYNVASEKAVDPIRFEPSPHPGGSLLTTAEDMTHFMTAYLESGRYGERSLLAPNTIREMFDPSSSPIRGASLGFWRMDMNGRTVVGHTGDDDIGGHAGMLLLPKEGIGIFIQLNSHGKSSTPVPAAMQMRHDFLQAFMDRYFPAPASKLLPTAPTAREHASIIAGEYVMTRRGEGDFFEARDALISFLALKLGVTNLADGTIETAPFMSHEERSRRWREVGPFVWQQIGGSGQLYATIENGRVKHIRISDRPYWYYEPVPFHRLSKWNIPGVAASAIVLVVLILGWPVVSWLRRRKVREEATDWNEARIATLSRLTGLVALLYLCGWMAVLALDVPGMMNGEIWIRLLQSVGIVVAAGTMVSAWSVILAVRHKRAMGVTLSRTLNAAALAMITWFSFVFHLISLKLVY